MMCRPLLGSFRSSPRGKQHDSPMRNGVRTTSLLMGKLRLRELRQFTQAVASLSHTTEPDGKLRPPSTDHVSRNHGGPGVGSPEGTCPRVPGVQQGGAPGPSPFCLELVQEAQSRPDQARERCWLHRGPLESVGCQAGRAFRGGGPAQREASGDSLPSATAALPGKRGTEPRSLNRGEESLPLSGVRGQRERAR